MTHLLSWLLKNYGLKRVNRCFQRGILQDIFIFLHQHNFISLVHQDYVTFSSRTMLHSPLFLGWFWIWRHQRRKSERIEPGNHMLVFCYTLPKASGARVSNMIVAPVSTLNCMLIIMICWVESNTSFSLRILMSLCCRCVAAYASDLTFLSVSLNPHRKKDLKTTSVSLDHS